MSDTQSLASEDSSTINGGTSIFVEIENVGKLSLGEQTSSQQLQKTFVIHDGLIAILGEDGTIILGDIRPDRGSSENWILHGRTGRKIYSKEIGIRLCLIAIF